MMLFYSENEQIGGRLGYSIRGTLQSQAKAFVDFQHESRVSSANVLVLLSVYWIKHVNSGLIPCVVIVDDKNQGCA